jgi:hypothetical protein
MKRLNVCLILTLVLLLVTSSVASAGRNPNPGILPPNSRVQGLTYGEWSAKFWQSIFSIPTPENPAAGHYGPECYLERIGNVGLAVTGGGTLTFDCTMPTGMKLLLVVLIGECSTLEGNGANEQELRMCAQNFVPADLQASIDGIAVHNLSEYLVWSPLFDITVPEDNILEIPAATGQSVSYGTWLMLTPLTPGQHTIHIQGAYPVYGFTYDATYHITVTPGH